MATTGAALRWARELWSGMNGESHVTAPAASYAAILEEAQQSPPGARGLVLLPHLMGERGPRPDPYATGTLYGLTVAHGIVLDHNGTIEVESDEGHGTEFRITLPLS